MADVKYKKRHDKQRQDLTILEKMNRNSAEDKIELGQIVQDAFNSKFGTVFVLLINGIIDEELAQSGSKGDLNSDRVLGRIEGLNKLQDSLETCIAQKEYLMEEKREEGKIASEKVELAHGPQTI